MEFSPHVHFIVPMRLVHDIRSPAGLSTRTPILVRFPEGKAINNPDWRLAAGRWVDPPCQDAGGYASRGVRPLAAPRRQITHKNLVGNDLTPEPAARGARAAACALRAEEIGLPAAGDPARGHLFLPGSPKKRRSTTLTGCSVR